MTWEKIAYDHGGEVVGQAHKGEGGRTNPGLGAFLRADIKATRAYGSYRSRPGPHLCFFLFKDIKNLTKVSI